EAAAPFISKSVWMDNGAEAGELDGRVWGGLDLSSVSDLTALVLGDETGRGLVGETGGVRSQFWLPGAGLAEKSRHDKVPYDLWAKQGFLNTTPGRAIEYEFVAEAMRAVLDQHQIQKIAFARALFEHLKPWLVKANFSEAELEKFEPYGQGTLSMTPA